MAVILQSRPAYLVQDGWINQPIDAEWRVLETARPILEQAITCIGRLEIESQLLPYAGTCFAIGPQLLATARHVAQIVTYQAKKDGLVPQEKIWVDFLREHDRQESRTVRIKRLIMIHPFFDFALFELEEPLAKNQLLSFSTVPTDQVLQQAGDLPICVVNYPAFDPRIELEAMRLVFGDLFEVKRLSPGKLMQQTADHETSLLHDCSTLGGAGGAPVLNVETGEVLGVNFAGRYLEANYCVPAYLLARDPYVRLAGCRFSDGSLPAWIDKWDEFAPPLPTGVDGLPGADAAPDHSDAEAAPPPVPDMPDQILSQRVISEIYSKMLEGNLVTDAKMQTVFSGLAFELKAALPRQGDLMDLLIQRLHFLNRERLLMGANTPLHIVLSTVRDQRRYDERWSESFDEIIKTVEDWEQTHLAGFQNQAESD